MSMEEYFLYRKGRQIKNPMYECSWKSNQTKTFRHKDNDGYFNSNGGITKITNKIRVPKLRASKKVWDRFYKLFPSLRGLKTYRGIKLRAIK